MFYAEYDMFLEENGRWNVCSSALTEFWQRMTGMKEILNNPALGDYRG